jgi:hypothetical protein
VLSVKDKLDQSACELPKARIVCVFLYLRPLFSFGRSSGDAEWDTL